ncbi:MAG TPA: hypothetical protein PLS69_10485, partial [Terricaulis sp.]|nr:hypothetical protein [Terricaulis sp.]
AYAARVGVLELPEGYDVQRQVVHNVRMKQLGYYWWVLALGAVVLIGVLALLALVARRLLRRKPAAPSAALKQRTLNSPQFDGGLRANLKFKSCFRNI